MQGDCAGGGGGGEVSPQPPGSLPQPEVPTVVAASGHQTRGPRGPSDPAVRKLRSSSALRGPTLPASPTTRPHPAWTPGSPAELRASWGQDGALRRRASCSRGVQGEPPQVRGRRPPAPARWRPSLTHPQPLPPWPGWPGAPPRWPPSTFLTPGETPPRPPLRPSGPPGDQPLSPRGPGRAAAVSIPLTSLGGTVASTPTEAPLSTQPKRQGQKKN